MNDKVITLDTTKYSKDGPFREPVVRCDSCQKLLFVKQLKKSGACFCGSRRIRNLRAFTPEELELMKKKDIDPDFLALFEEVNEDD